MFAKSCNALIASILLAASSSVTAQTQWVERTFAEPYVRSLRVFGNTPTVGTNTLHAVSLGGGLFKGTDDGSGIVWQSIGGSLPTTRFWGAAYSNVNTFYVGSDGYGVFKTTDGGATFTAINGSGVTKLGCTRARNINSPSAGTLYVGTAGCNYDSGVYKTVNDGVNWARVGVGVIPNDADVNQYLIVSASVHLVATSNYGSFRSTDSGGSWAAANSGLPNSPLMSAPNLFGYTCGSTGCASLMLSYVFGQGVYASTDGGTTWSARSSGLPTNAIAIGGISRNGSDWDLGFDKLGVYTSSDDGLNWSLSGDASIEPRLSFVRSVVQDPNVATRVYLPTYEGVLRSNDDGATWTRPPMGKGLVHSHIIDQANSNTVVAASASVLRVGNISAANLAGEVTRGDAGITGTTLDGVIYTPFRWPTTYYVTTNHQGVFKTSDSGATWTARNNGLPETRGQSMRLSFDRYDALNMYAVSSNEPGIGVYKSTDGGDNWTENNGDLPVDARSIGRLAIDPNVPTTLYAATRIGAFKSINGGTNWTQIYSAQDTGAQTLRVSLVFLDGSTNPTTVYLVNDHTNADGTVLASSGILKSTNGGGTWTNTRPAKRAQNLRVLNGGHLVAGFADGPGQPAIMRSIDRGVTWTPFSAGLNGNDIRNFASDKDDGVVLAASLENGFYVAQGVQSLSISSDPMVFVSESVQNATVTVSRTGGSAGTVSVHYFSGGNVPIPGQDYTATNGTLTWAAGDMAAKTISVPIINDLISEDIEKFVIVLENPVGAVLGPTFASTVTIIDDDSVIQFANTAVTVGEGAGNVVLTVNRTGSIDLSQNVTYNTSSLVGPGNAAPTADYAAQVAKVLTFAPGETTKTITIPIVDDNLLEGNEIFKVTLSAPTNGATLGASTVNTVTIVDNENGVGFANAAVSVLESAGNAVLTVNRFGTGSGTVSVNYATGTGTATANVDYTTQSVTTLTWGDGDTAPKQITIPIANDGTPEANETFTVILSSPVGGSIAGPTTATVTILDNENTIQFTGATFSGSENGTATVTVSRTGSAGGPATVNWTTVDGTGPGGAVGGVDFTSASGSLNWAAGDKTNRTFTVTLLNDNIVSGAKTFQVQLQGDVTGATLGNPASATITRNENDSGIAFDPPTYQVNEATSTVTLTVKRFGPVTAGATVQYTTGDVTAFAGSDYTSKTGTLTWSAGDANAKTIVVNITNDAMADEPPETFTVKLQNPVGAVLGAASVATVTILDNDIPIGSQVSFSQPKYTVNEGVGATVTLTVNRAIVAGGDLDDTVTVNYATLAGTAVATTDFTAKSGTLTFGPGVTSQDIVINISNDALIEPQEAFKVNLTAPSPGLQLGTPSQATVLIFDDDEVFPPGGKFIPPPTGWTLPYADGVMGWHVSQGTPAAEGQYSLQTDTVFDNESAIVTYDANFTAAGNVTFKVKVSSEPGFDKLIFTIDGVVKGEWSGNQSAVWTSVTVPIATGAHQLKWEYKKDGSGLAGADAAWIDQLVLPTNTPTP